MCETSHTECPCVTLMEWISLHSEPYCWATLQDRERGDPEWSHDPATWRRRRRLRSSKNIPATQQSLSGQLDST